MAANDAYINPGTEVTPTITLASLGTGAGRASAAITFGAAYTTARPDRYRWTGKCFWAAGAVVGDRLDFYLAEADSDDNYAGGVAAADAAFTDEDGLKNMKLIGGVTCTHATEEQEYAAGVFTTTAHKGVLVVWNSGTADLHATEANSAFKFLPIPMGLQS